MLKPCRNILITYIFMVHKLTWPFKMYMECVSMDASKKKDINKK